MIRKLFLPALLVGLLGGCVTDYGYRDGYYYGHPSVEYRYYDYGYPYGGYGGYPGYGYYPYYGYYGYGYPYYRQPYYYNPYYYHRPRQHGPGHNDDDHDNPPPWRNLDPRRRVEDRRRDYRVQTPPPGATVPGPGSTTPRPPTPRYENRGEGPRVREAPRRNQETRRNTTEER